jgi:hypothetical protein
MTDHKLMHQQLLDMLGAKNQQDAARIIAGFHDAHLSAQAKVQVTGDIVARFKLAAKILVRGREVFGEDVETLVDVLRILERCALSTTEAGDGNDFEVGEDGYFRKKFTSRTDLVSRSKAQVTDEDVEIARREYHNASHNCLRAALESFAARLPQGTQGNAPDAASFVCYLIDKHEKDVIYEESLHGWFADFLKDPRYSHGAQSSGNSGEVAQGSQGEAVALECYDAGYLGDGGGGDVSWWHDYIRSELERAHDFYQSQVDAITHPADRAAVPDGMVLIRRDELEEVVGDAIKWLTSSAGFDELGSHRDGIVKLYEALLSAAPTLAGRGGDGHG